MTECQTAVDVQTAVDGCYITVIENERGGIDHYIGSGNYYGRDDFDGEISRRLDGYRRVGYRVIKLVYVYGTDSGQLIPDNTERTPHTGDN